MSATVCYRHPTRPAVEHCEECKRPLCGSCLWYADSGHRYCPDHAATALQAGETVHPPERYAEAIVHSEASAAQPNVVDAPYQGNSTDITALIALVNGLAGLGLCIGAGWLLPFLGVILGLVAWWNAKDSVNPRRTRFLGGVGLATGGLFFVITAMWIFMWVFMCLMPTFIISNLSTRGPQGFPTPYFGTPTPFPITPFPTP